MDTKPGHPNDKDPPLPFSRCSPGYKAFIHTHASIICPVSACHRQCWDLLSSPRHCFKQPGHQPNPISWRHQAFELLNLYKRLEESLATPGTVLTVSDAYHQRLGWWGSQQLGLSRDCWSHDWGGNMFLGEFPGSPPAWRFLKVNHWQFGETTRCTYRCLHIPRTKVISPTSCWLFFGQRCSHQGLVGTSLLANHGQVVVIG